jgi:hypothetical protein
MIISTGLGFLVAVIVFGTCLVTNLAFDAQYGKGFYSNNLWVVGLALLIGGILSAQIGFFLRTRTGREVIDAETGEVLIIDRSHHTFFFVPMHWAGVSIAAIGVGLAVYDLIAN